MKKSIAPLICGLLLVLAGIGYIGAVVFDWHFTVFFDGWWTLFIIIPSLVSIFSNGPKPFNVAAFLLGGLLLLRAQNLVPGRHFGTVIVSAAILYAGVVLIVKFFRGGTAKHVDEPYTYNGSNSNGNSNYYSDQGQTTANSFDATSNDGYSNTSNNYTEKKHGSYDGESQPCYNAILSGMKIRNTSTDFKGAKISAILGGADIDLSDVVITQDITVYATTIMGGIDIIAPRNVRIMITKTDILGGTDCKAFSMPQGANVPVVTFNCTTIMGGIDIK